MLTKKLDNKKLLLVVSPLILVLVVLFGFFFYIWGSPFKYLGSIFKAQPKTTATPVVEKPATPEGPTTSAGNYSNSLASSKKGSLKVVITDPKPSSNPTPKNSPKNSSGVSELSSLFINVSRAEVHLAQLAGSEEENDSEETPSPTPSPTISPTESPEPTATPEPTTSPETEETPLASPSPKGAKVNKWETLTLTKTSFDLIDLKNRGGALEDLGITSLAAGHYTEIRLYIESATGVTEDGETVNIEIPGKNNCVKIVREFDITADGTTTLTIDFNAPESYSYSGGRYHLRPVIAKFIIEKPDGTKEEDTDID